MAWYILLGNRLWNGFRNVLLFLMDNMEIVGRRVALEVSTILICVEIVQ